MQPMFSVRMLLPAAALAGLLGLSGPSGAQEVAPALSLDEVRNCMCLEREMATEREEMDLRNGILKERENELERVGMEIEVKRAAMDPEDEQAIAELKALISRQQTLREQMRRDILPSYQSSVQAFNAVGAAYNQQCAGRRIFKPDVEKLQDSLQCPARP